MKGSTLLHLAAPVASCSALLVALAGCGTSDGGSTAQQQQRGTVRIPAVVACPDNVLCIVGDHWDTALCRCVPNEDGGAEMDASGAACPDNVLCIVGDHWDTVLCRCVPNEDGGAGMDASGDAAPADDSAATPDGGEAGDEGSCPGH
jgi:hypothetical protein